MLLSCTWLSELLGRPIAVAPPFDKGDGPFTAPNIAARLTSLGLEVEGLAYFDLPGVIVGRVDAINPHPNATKLNVVDLFDGEQTLTVVCGASNLPAPGGKVAFAPVGVTLPGGLELSQRELRGVTSNGMICSEDELEIGADASGILVLPEDAEPGTELRELVPGIRDAVIEISVTPNRPDALGHLGVARDLGLALGCKVELPATLDVSDAPEQPELVELAAPDRCPRYLGYALDGATIGPAPLWMRVRLHRVGLRALNNVVDVTNYVLMESGQPLHAFDRDKLAEGRVVVRRASAGEPMTLLDDSEIELRTDDLVIADAARPQALAGVMGGQGSMVEDQTTRLLLELAFFSPSPIRATARRYGLHTDSSHRFERCVDYGAQLEFAAGRALALLEQCAGIRCVGRLDARAPAELPQTPTIAFDPAHVGRLLGMPIPAAEVERILTGLAIEIEREAEDRWQCRPPSYRPDLGRAVDLVEEVMRHHGLDHLPVRHSISTETCPPLPANPRRELSESLREALRAAGFHEHVAFAFIGDQQLEGFAEPPPERRVRLRNPMNERQTYMRPHLLPALLEALAYNHARHARPLALFEVGRVYHWPATAPTLPDSPTAAVDRQLPAEPDRAGALRASRARTEIGTLARATTAELLAILQRVGLHARLAPAASPVTWLHPGIQIGLWIDERQVGVVGEVHPDVLATRDLAELEVAYGELWVDALPPVPVVAYAPLTRFPATTRDLSIDLSDAVGAHAVLAALEAAAAEHHEHGDDPVRLANPEDPRRAIVSLEDYRGEGVANGRHALLLRLSYGAAERSVTDAEVKPLHEAIVASALERLRELDPELHVR